MWPFRRSRIVAVAACERCGHLRNPQEILARGEFKRVLRDVQHNVAIGVIREVTPPALRTTPVEALSIDGPWPDFVEHYFECPKCGFRFRLAVDTYRGSNGEWEP